MTRAEHGWTSWRKSSFSGTGNGNCVEIAWRKSSYSGTGNGGCVEVAFGATAVGIRDSKDADGPRLEFGTSQWREFLSRPPR